MLIQCINYLRSLILDFFLEFLRVWAGGAAELGEYESRHPRQQVQPLLRRLQQRTGQGNDISLEQGQIRGVERVQ